MLLRIIVAGILLVAGNAIAQADDFEGYWVTPNFNSVVEISRCDQSLCAEIAWLWEIAVAGKQLRDAKNPDTGKRKNSMLGLPLFRKFKQDGKRWRGRIYNPQDGRRYRASITGINRNMLKLRGCWGPFCQTQRWRRLGSFSMPSIMELEKRK
jgi:uncharacterized protein (DUF2147 family)